MKNELNCSWCGEHSFEDSRKFAEMKLKKQKSLIFRCDNCGFNSVIASYKDSIYTYRSNITYFRKLYKTRPNYVINTKNCNDAILGILQAEPERCNRWKHREVLV